MNTGTFLRRRSLRVLPGYWFALTFCVVVLGQMLGSVKNAFLYYSLLFPFASQNVALGGGPGQEGNYAIPQAWSLTAEFVFYLMLPVIAILLVRLAAKKAPLVQVRYALLDLRSRSTCSGSCSGSTTSSPNRRGSAWR